jgi:hypothetical protein
MTVTIALLDTTEARRLTERIRVALDRVSTSWADLAERVAEAYERRADLALGYDSWQTYAAAELKPSEGIAAEVRRELVGLLSARGMSIRAIAPVAGVKSHDTIARDLRQVSDLRTPEVIDPVTGEVLTEPARVTGLDGKTYTRPTPVPQAAPRRRPLTDAFWEAAYDLGKKAESLLRLVEDDRWASNRDAVADKNLAQMRETANTLARVLAAIENS